MDGKVFTKKRKERFQVMSLKVWAQDLDLYVATHSPGDGITRYRVFKGRAERLFNEGDGIFTAIGRSDLETFLRGYSLAMETCGGIIPMEGGNGNETPEE